MPFAESATASRRSPHRHRDRAEPPALGGPAMISDRFQIAALMSRLVRERVPITVMLPEHEGFYSSVLLDSDREQRSIVADELFPARGHALLGAGMEVRVITHLDGIELRFRTRVESVQHDSGGASYRLTMPNAADYHQRRNAFRVPVSPALAVAVLARDESGAVAMRGTLADISHAGMRVAAQTSIVLASGLRLACEVALPGRTIEALAELRHSESDRRVQRITYFGFRFAEIETDAQRAINHFTASLQRDQLRSRRLIQS